MTDISVRSESFQSENHDWLGSAHGLTATKTITLDVSAFTKADHYPNGFIPSGIVLAKITATGLYGPYNNAGAGGLEVAAGLLAFTAKVPNEAVTTVDTGAALLEHGIVIESKLPIAGGTTGSIDAAGKTDLAGRVIFR